MFDVFDFEDVTRAVTGKPGDWEPDTKPSQVRRERAGYLLSTAFRLAQQIGISLAVLAFASRFIF